MSFTIVWEGSFGAVILRREKPDGTFVLLACEELPADAPPTGPVFAPEAEEDDGGGGVFPLAEIMRVHAAAPRALELDIDQLPAGLLRFDAGTFSRRVVESLRAGVLSVALDLQNAPDWGFRRHHRPPPAS